MSELFPLRPLRPRWSVWHSGSGQYVALQTSYIRLHPTVSDYAAGCLGIQSLSHVRTTLQHGSVVRLGFCRFRASLMSQMTEPIVCTT